MNPRIVTKAFTPPAGDAATGRLSPLTMGHVFALEAIGSPFALGGDITLRDIIVASYLLSKPAAEARRLAGDPDKLLRLSVPEYADTLTPADTQRMTAEVSRVVREAFATFLPPTGAGGDPKGEGFPPPRPESDGASPCSPASSATAASPTATPSTRSPFLKRSLSRRRSTCARGGSSTRPTTPKPSSSANNGQEVAP